MGNASQWVIPRKGTSVRRQWSPLRLSRWIWRYTSLELTIIATSKSATPLFRILSWKFIRTSHWLTPLNKGTETISYILTIPAKPFEWFMLSRAGQLEYLQCPSLPLLSANSSPPLLSPSPFNLPQTPLLWSWGLTAAYSAKIALI